MNDDPLTEFLCNLILTGEQKLELYRRFEDEVNRSMDKKTYDTVKIKSYISYVQNMPTGQEKGSFLTYHLGRRTSRLALLKLDGHAPEILKTKNYDLSLTLFRSNAVPFFDHLAQCVNSFLKENNIRTTYGKLPLCLSLAYEHKNLDISHAILKYWPYKDNSFIGCDMGQLMNDALKRRDLEVECVAVVNNTIGTLFSRSRWQECRIGVIVGLETNACLLEDTKKIGRLEDEFKDKPFVVINYEWGYFGDKGGLNFMRSKYDREVDDKSILVHARTLDKLVSAFYLGQLFTLVVLQAVKDDYILTHENKKALIKKLNFRKCLQMQDIYDLGLDSHPNYSNARRIFDTALDVKEPEINDCRALTVIAECIIKRSATIVGVLLTYLIIRIEQKSVIIAIEGEIFRNHIHYINFVNQTIRDILPKEIEFELQLADHGPERGAALVIANALPPNWGSNGLKSKVINLPRKETKLQESKCYPSCNCKK